MIEQRVTLRYDAQQIPAIVQAVQGDTGRDVIFELADYEIPAGSTANYYIDKPDGNAVYNSAEVISSTEILAHLTEQALAVPGRNNGQVRILSDGEVITSFDFVLEVEAFRGILRLQSETEVNIFDEALHLAAEDAIAEIQAQTPVVTGMQNSIAPSYDNTKTYAFGDYVMYNAQLYKCTTAITTAEVWTAAHWTQVPLANDLNKRLLMELINANAFDIIPFCSPVSLTHRGVTFSWSDGDCTVSGTASGGAALDTIFSDLNGFPIGMIPSGTYRIKYSSTNVLLQVLANRNGAYSGILVSAYNDIVFTVPSDLSGVTIRLAVVDGTTVNETVRPVILSGTYSNDELSRNGLLFRGALANGTDFDDVVENGFWFTTSTHTYDHCPLPPGVAGVVFNYVYSASLKLQIVYSLQTNANIWIRSCIGGNWFTWAMMKDYKAFISRGLIATDTDFDTITTPGVYFFNSGYTYTHSPFSNTYGGALVVLPEAATGSIVQIAVSYSASGDNRVKLRMGLQNALPAQWADVNGNINNYTSEHYENTYNITCSPTITTDTNNYLASTGDQTDRTADIQAMLAQNGVCHLGPGLFMVSGVDIPDYKSVIGSGKYTTVRLLPSVTNGYAFKLNNQSSVSNLRISGGTSAPTLSPTVGSRHGILFEGTKQSGQSGGITKKRSAIDHCIISNMTGGGITCIGTGFDLDSNILVSDCFIDHCNAGIYIPYFSEFHRFCNCAVTYCYYGCVNNGGNNSFSNCDFSGNRVGILIDNSTGQSPNNSHGTYNCCTVNHSYSDDGTINEGTAIKLLGLQWGEIFNGLQLFYGAIVIDNCSGVRFIGGNFGNLPSKIPITITDSTVITFTDCTFAQSPELTQSNNNALKFTDCYLLDGTEYNPLSA